MESACHISCTGPRNKTPVLLLYTQVDRLIMEVCAQRLTDAPDEDAELSLAMQVDDESRHVSIQRQWMRQSALSSRRTSLPNRNR